jgi:hypothetical protein
MTAPFRRCGGSCLRAKILQIRHLEVVPFAAFRPESPAAVSKDVPKEARIAGHPHSDLPSRIGPLRRRSPLARTSRPWRRVMLARRRRRLTALVKPRRREQHVVFLDRSSGASSRLAISPTSICVLRSLDGLAKPHHTSPAQTPASSQLERPSIPASLSVGRVLCLLLPVTAAFQQPPRGVQWSTTPEAASDAPITHCSKA